MAQHLIKWLFIALCITGISCNPCVQKVYEGADNNVVCVCNSTYCDTLEIDDVIGHKALIITSSLSGKRFEKKTVEFKKRKRNGQSITVDPKVTFQKINGFGGAFTDSVGINLRSLSLETRNKLLEAYFSSSGIEYTLGRVPIASTDFSTREYSYDDVFDDFPLEYFQLQPEDYDYKIPFILQAKALSNSSLRLLASPWSAPGWMKATGRMKGGGALRNDSKIHASYADYLVKFFEHYHQKGIDFWSMTIENEPTAGALPDYGWQAMYFSAATQRDFVRDHLGPKIRQNNLTKELVLMTFDDDRLMLVPWADIFFADKQVSAYVDGIGVHWYGNAFYPSWLLSLTHKRHPDKFILATEACNGYFTPRGPIMGDWYRAEAYARDIINDLNNHVTGWVDWNLCLDEKGGPTWVHNEVDSPIIVNQTADEFYKQPMFYAMGHFSKFMRPGSRRIALSSTLKNPLVQATATVQNSRTLVILNGSESPEQLQVVDSLNPSFSIELTVESHSIVSIVWHKQ